MSYAKLANSILSSSLWVEPHATRIVWITILAMKNMHGEVMTSIPGLASIARVDLKECEEAIDKFLKPDPYSRSKNHEGRRLEAIDGGFLVLNHEKYKEYDSQNHKREMNAIRQQRHRDKKCVTKALLVTNESRHVDVDVDVDQQKKTTSSTTLQATGSKDENFVENKPRKSSPKKEKKALTWNPVPIWIDVYKDNRHMTPMLSGQEIGILVKFEKLTDEKHFRKMMEVYFATGDNYTAKNGYPVGIFWNTRNALLRAAIMKIENEALPQHARDYKHESPEVNRMFASLFGLPSANSDNRVDTATRCTNGTSGVGFDDFGVEGAEVGKQLSATG